MGRYKKRSPAQKSASANLNGARWATRTQTIAKPTKSHVKLQHAANSVAHRLRQDLRNVRRQLSRKTKAHSLLQESAKSTHASLTSLRSGFDELSGKYSQSCLLFSGLFTQFAQLRSRLVELEQLLLVTQKHLCRAQDQVLHYKARVSELGLQNNRLSATIRRARTKLAHNKVSLSTDCNFYIKQKGVITDNVRNTVLNLTMSGVSAACVFPIIVHTAYMFGIRIHGTLCDTSINRIILEGGAAAYMQLGQAMHESPTATISSDSTSIRSINYVSKHAVVHSRSDPSTPITLVLPITTIDDHTSQTQLDDWVQTIKDIFATYSRCLLLGELSAETWRAFVCKIKGASTNHAADQKLLIQLITQWKRVIDRELHGAAVLRSKNPIQVLQLLSERLADSDSTESIPWEDLSLDEQTKLVSDAWRKLCIPYGEAAYQALSKSKQNDVDRVIWAGCCMHKSLNAAKGGFDAISHMWALIEGAPPPTKLPNKENAISVNQGSQEKRLRVLSLSKGGAAKLANLCGALFKNKNDKKGLQDTYKILFEIVFGTQHTFPDTSNTRFGTHCAASGELIVNHSFYCDLMRQVHDQKTIPGFTNLEQNIANALVCPSTQTELCAAAIYGELVDKPYMKRVRSSDGIQHENLLDLGPLHTDVIQYCQQVVEHPSIVLTLCSNTSQPPRTFNGYKLDCPEIFWAILRFEPQLPYLRQGISAFFAGALEKWRTFSEELSEDSIIAKMSAEERQRAFLHPTNDLNEGALGLLRVTLRRCPNISLHAYNARMLYRRNGTSDFIRKLSGSQRKLLRQEARKLGSGGVERRRRLRLGELKTQKARQNAERRKKQIDRINALRARADERMQGVQVELDPAAIKAMKGSNLDDQIEWHRRRGIIDQKTGKNVIGGTSKLKVQEKKQLLYDILTMQTEDEEIPRRIAPEDVYSFGCVCIEILTHNPPFHNIKILAVIALILKGKVPSRPSSERCHGLPPSDSLWSIISSCLERAASNRASISTVLSNLRRLQDEDHTSTSVPSAEHNGISPPPSTPSTIPHTSLGGARMLLNNYLQQRYGSSSMAKWNVAVTGPPNHPCWTAVLTMNDIEYGRGTGVNQGTAKDEAAVQALKLLLVV